MNRREPDASLESLLEHGRALRPVPSSVRARLLERARATSKLRLPQLELLDIAPRRWSLRATALVAALVAGVASASLGFSARWSRSAEQTEPARSSSVLPRGAAQDPPAQPVPERAPDLSAEPSGSAQSAFAAARVVAADSAGARAGRPAPDASAPASHAAELELLQRAHKGYTDRDFATALRLVAEHARRFPSGVLSEQREALRVRSLAGAGRNAEAQRAAEVFAKRFPRSVLLPRLQKLAGE
jgi:hypothetical protein